MACNCGRWRKTSKHSRHRACDGWSLDVFYDQSGPFPGYRAVVGGEGYEFDLPRSRTLTAAKRKADRKYRSVSGC